jgi:predicted SAM-dependent methyltransferase
MKLNLGCGDDIREGYINADLYSPTADVKCNLDEILPWEDNSVDEIICIHTLEHCKDPIVTVNEMIRICKSGAKITIEVPHYNHAAAVEAAHTTFFNDTWFNYWNIPQKEYHKYYPRTGYLKLINLKQKATWIGKLIPFSGLRMALTKGLNIPLIFSLIYTLEVSK